MNNGKLKIETVIIASFAIFAALWFPIKNYLDGDLQETVVVAGHTITAGADIPVRVVVRHRKYGRPVPNAKIKITLINESRSSNFDNQQFKGEFRTNIAGTVDTTFSSGEIKPGRYQIGIAVNSYLGHDLLFFPLTVQSAKEIFLSTDKPRYRPGETVRFRSFLRNSQNYKPLQNKNVIYQINDPKGNIVFRKTVRSSEFGLASSKFTLSKELNKGEYSLIATTGKTSKVLDFQVTDYTLPKFRVSLKMKENSFRPRNTLTGTLTAQYFFGKPVTGAKISVSSVLFLANGKNPIIIDQEKRVSATSITNSDGTASFSLEQPSACHGKTGLLILKLTVTDNAENSISIKHSVRISEKSLRITLYPEAGGVVPKIENKIYIRTFSDDGTPVTAMITAYENENARKNSHRTVTNKNGIGVIAWTPHKRNSKLIVKASKHEWEAASSDISPGEYTEDLPAVIIRTDKAIYNADESAKITILSPNKNGSLFLDAADAQGRITRMTIDLATLNQNKAFILLDKFKGLVSLTGSIIGKNGKLQKSSAYFVVSGNPHLILESQIEKESVKPGEKVRINLALKDNAGLPVRGTVSINIIDEKLLTYADRSFLFFPPELTEGISTKFANLPAATGKEDTDKIKAQIIFTANIHNPVKSNIKVHLNKLVKKGYVSSNILQDAEEFVRSHKDLSFLNPELSKIAELLKNNENRRTTAVSSALRKEKIAKIRRKDFLSKCKIGGILLILGCFIGFLIIHYRIKALTWIVFIVIILIIAAMLLPALSMARESAHTISHTNNLKQISLAMRMAEEYGDEIIEKADNIAKKQTGIRIRNFFPENLYWNPEAVTDDNGKIELEFPMSDSITSWQGIFDAVDKNGNTVSSQMKLKSFMPFFMEIDAPRKLTMGDTVTLPLTCHNYLKESSSVTLHIKSLNGKLSCETRKLILQLKPEEVKTVFLKLHALKPGKGLLRVRAIGKDVVSSDALEQSFSIIPSGKKQINETNGILKGTTKFSLHIPKNTVPGSEKLILRIFPDTFSETVEGLESLISKPHGCFEQTSSATYPNVMILRYLKKISSSRKKTIQKAKKYIRQGYQRLLTFEAAGGGFSLYGRKHADTLLTAYGIMEFSDMAKVVFIDRNVIKRAQRFLFSHQQPNGSWNNNLVRTAYIAWALSESCDKSDGLKNAVKYLRLAVKSNKMTNYTRALTVLTLLNLNSRDNDGLRLAHKIINSVNFTKSNQAFWKRDGKTAFDSSGRYGKTIITALSIMALRKGRIAPDIRMKGARYLVTAGSGRNGWGSTQATLLAIKALLEETPCAPLTENALINIRKNGKTVRSIMIKKDESDIMRIADLTRTLGYGSNNYSLQISNNSELGFSLTGSYYLPATKQRKSKNRIAITVTPDRRKLRTGETVKCKISLINRADKDLLYPTAVISIPPGFAPVKNSLQNLVEKNIIKKYEISNGHINLYAERINANSAKIIPVVFRSVSHGKVSIPPALLYEYYTPSNCATSSPETIETF